MEKNKTSKETLSRRHGAAKRDKKRSKSSDRLTHSNGETSHRLNRDKTSKISDSCETLDYDLSYDSANPGVFKIFGEQLQEGSSYKSILVSSRSTVSGILGEVLERYSISRKKRHRYVICDVIGSYSESEEQQFRSLGHRSGGLGGLFNEIYARILQPEELISQVQSLWRPTAGHVRRFEIRFCPPTQTTRMAYESDPETRDINCNARRLARTKLPGTNSLPNEEVDTEPASSSAETTPREGYSNCIPKEMSNSECQTDFPSSPPPVTIRGKSARTSLPLGPYLLLLKGCDQQDDLINELYDRNTIGGDCDIGLNTSKIPMEVCVIRCEHRSSANAPVKERQLIAKQHSFRMILDPTLNNGIISVNDRPVCTAIQLTPGDIICIGEDYIFLFKDTSEIPDSSLVLPSLSHFSRSTSRCSSRHQQKGFSPFSRSSSRLGFVSEFAVSVEHSSETGTTNSSITDSFTHSISRVKNLIYTLLSQIFNKSKEGHIECPTSATLLILLCEQSLRNSGECQEVTRYCSELVTALCQRAELSLVINGRLYEELICSAGLVFEVYQHCQRKLEDCLENHRVQLRKWEALFGRLALQIIVAAVKFVEENWLSYSSAIIHDNQFMDSQNLAPGQQSMQDLLECFHHLIHPFHALASGGAEPLERTITLRLLALLCESCTREIISDIRYLCWRSGVQLRANINLLEEWLQLRGLNNLPGNPLNVLSHVADLLAIPRSQLHQMSWTSLRGMFPGLPESVLLRILENYDNKQGAHLINWMPSDEDSIEAGYDPSCALEDNLQLVLQDDRVFELFACNPINIIYQSKKDNFRIAVNKLDGELKDSGFPKQWNLLVDAALDISVSTNSSSTLCDVPQVPSRQLRARPFAGESMSQKPSPLRSQSSANISHREVKGDSAYGSSSTTKSRYIEDWQSTRTSVRGERRRATAKNRHSGHRHGGYAKSLGHYQSQQSSLPSLGGDDSRSSRTTSTSRDDDDQDSLVTLTPSVDAWENDSTVECSEGVTVGNGCRDFGGNYSFFVENGGLDSSCQYEGYPPEDLYLVTLTNEDVGGIGLGLVDGERTSLQNPGVYIRTFVPGGSAELDGRLSLGDQILSVNGASLLECTYEQSMKLIKKSRETVQLLCARSQRGIIPKLISEIF